MRLMLLTALLAASFAASAADAVLPPGVGYAGRTPHDLTVQWWKWLETHRDLPANDKTGAWCRLGSMGPLWFLAGSTGAAPVRRTCYIPYGRTLFFPLITMTQWPDELDPHATCERSMTRLATLNDHAKDLYVILNGKPLAEPARYRVAGRHCFDLTVHGRTQGPRKYPTAQDGYWVLVKPLPKGVHHLRFGGRYHWPVDSFGDAVQSIEYKLHIY